MERSTLSVSDRDKTGCKTREAKIQFDLCIAKLVYLLIILNIAAQQLQDHKMIIFILGIVFV